MNSACVTTVQGADVAQVVAQTVSRWPTREVRGGVLVARGLDVAALTAALAAQASGVQLLGVVADGAPGLEAVWLTGPVHVAVVRGDALATRAVEQLGVPSHRVRLALAHLPSLAQVDALFETLPRGAGFVGAEVTRGFTHEGPADAALLVADWPTKLAVGFEGLAAALQRKGLDATQVRAALSYGASAGSGSVLVPAKSLAGVRDRAPAAPASAVVALSDVVERAEA